MTPRERLIAAAQGYRRVVEDVCGPGARPHALYIGAVPRAIFDEIAAGDPVHHTAGSRGARATWHVDLGHGQRAITLFTNEPPVAVRVKAAAAAAGQS